MSDLQHEANIQALEALGLGREIAVLSLKKSKGNVSRAADLAFESMQQSDKDEVSPPSALAPALPATYTARRGTSSSAPTSPPTGSARAPQRPINVRWPSSGEIVRKVRGDEADSGEEADSSEDERSGIGGSGGGVDEWVDDVSSPQGGSTPKFPASAHRRLPSASSAISGTIAGGSGSTTLGGTPSIASSSRTGSIYSTTSSKKAKSRWLTSSSHHHSSSKRSSVKLGSSPPASTPLSHSVLRSLPLGSMVPLGDQKKMSSSKARKLDAEAAKHDETAQNLVANLFAKADSSTTSLPAAAVGGTTKEKEKEKEKEDRESSYYRPRLNLFGRRSHNSSPTASPQLANASLPTSTSPNALPAKTYISTQPSVAQQQQQPSSAPAPPPPTVTTIPPTPIVDHPPSSIIGGAASNQNVTFDPADDDASSRRGRERTSRLATRSMSPFFSRGRSRSRAQSPSSEVGALRGRQGTSEANDSDSDDDTGAYTSGDEPVGYDDDGYDDSDYEEPDDLGFDEVTDINTDANAEATMVPAPEGEDGKMIPWSDLYQTQPQDLGEGPNVVVPSANEFMFQRSAAPSASGLEFLTGRPEFGRDRCTVKLIQGDPDRSLEKSGKRQRRYVVASDLSEESGYAVEWAIGTVARDGDEIWVVNVQENESKVDPKNLGSQDKQEKIKLQRERQGLAQSLARQVTAVLQRTHLNLTIICQAVHSKNSRHMLIDLIDFLEPTLMIVGSRGLGKLKGTILGSMSHYLVQKSSVPVMVARRRLRRHLKRTDPSQLRQAARVSLAEAGIEKVAPGKHEVLDAADLEHDEDVSGKDEAHRQEVEGITGDPAH